MWVIFILIQFINQQLSGKNHELWPTIEYKGGDSGEEKVDRSGEDNEFQPIRFILNGLW